MHIDSLPFFDVELPLKNDAEMKDIAKSIVEQLRPGWDVTKVSFKIFTAGITNKVFCAIYEPKVKSSEKERIIFRVYGKNTEKIIDRKEELENWLRLAAIGCAAPLFGTFKNGIVCGFLPGDELNVTSVRDPSIYPKICKAMSRIHRIKPDTSVVPAFYKHVEKFFDNLSEQFPSEILQERFDSFAEKHRLSLRNDYLELKKIIESLDEQVVFCHNDLLVHNIVYDNDIGKVSFIDYEYADFNYQGYDIANHFNEYAGVENVDYSLCPGEEEKRRWIEKYLEYYLRRKPLDTEVDKMLQQNGIFEAASHFLWSIWALVQSQNSMIDFDYLGYALTRYEMYQERLATYARLCPGTSDKSTVENSNAVSISVH